MTASELAYALASHLDGGIKMINVLRPSRTRKGRAHLTGMACAVAATIAVASTASASLITVETDSSWLARGLTTDTDPAAGWNTNLAFNTTGWTNASANVVDCLGTADCIWFDGQFSATRYTWLRKTFDLSGPFVSASLSGGVDDDADIYINGVQVLSDHNGTAANFGPIDILARLVSGTNFIAVKAQDNIPVFGQNHDFAATLRIETLNAIPEPASLLLLATGFLGLGVVNRRNRRRA